VAPGRTQNRVHQSDDLVPIWRVRTNLGTVYDRTLLHAQDDAATVRLAGLVNPRIEPEICFHLKAAPAESSDLDLLLDSIDWMAHSVEIVQSHHPGWRFRLPDCTVDNGLHGRLVVGEPVPTKEVPDLVERLVDVDIVLRQGDTEIDRGTGANVLGSPLLALAHLVRVLAAQPEAAPLSAGAARVQARASADRTPARAARLSRPPASAPSRVQVRAKAACHRRESHSGKSCPRLCRWKAA